MNTKTITPGDIASCAVASLPTRPTAPAAFGGKGYTATQMKEAFDRLPRLIADRLNALIGDTAALEGALAVLGIDAGTPAERSGEELQRRMQHIRASVQGWREADVVLSDGELAIEQGNGRIRLKVGDGTNAFSALPYLDGNVRTAADTLRTGDDLRLGACPTLALTLPASVEEDFYALVTFDSPDPATQLTVNRPVCFSGDDTVSGAFSPAANRHYTLMLWNDGALQGLVRSVDRA